jgi:flagellar motor switch protein FliG
MAFTERQFAEFTGIRKAAILLVLLGDEAAAQIYRSLSQEELQSLTQEIAELEYVSPEIASQVLQEYHRMSVTQDFMSQGGPDYAGKLLVKAFGSEAASGLLELVTQAQEASTFNLDSLQKADPQQLAKFVEGEHPQTIALLLAHLGLKSASTMLMLLPEKIRAQAVARLAEMRQFSPEIVQKISVVLHKKLQSLGEQNRRAYAGVKAVADLLNNLGISHSKVILDTIEQDNPRLAISVRNLMFTFEDLLAVPESGIRELLGAMDKKTLALALKGATEDLKNHIFKSMSTRAVDMLKEDMEVLGPVRGREVTQAQQEAVSLARKLESEGKLVLKNERDDEYVI